MTVIPRTKLLSALAVAACAGLWSAPAHAQYVPAPPPPPPPAPAAGPPGAAPAATPIATPAASVRRGLTLGGGLGLGRISAGDADIECVDCDGGAAAGSFDLHAGWMLNPRLALELELWLAGQPLDSAGDNTLVQSMAMVAAQYWLRPRWWVKAGVGSAQLTQQYAPTDQQTELAKGTAVMGAVGYEAYRHRGFVLDLQLRVGLARYKDLADDYQQGSVQVGISWY